MASARRGLFGVWGDIICGHILARHRKWQACQVQSAKLYDLYDLYDDTLKTEVQHSLEKSGQG